MSRSLSPRIRVLIVDDEPAAQRVLDGLLEAEVDIEVVGICGDGVAARAALVEHGVDVVFLDVRMPGLDGFALIETLEAAREQIPLVVFVTAYDEHALRAFEVGAADYLVKPFDDDRFQATLRRVRKRLDEGSQSTLTRHLRSLVERLQDDRTASGRADQGRGPDPSAAHRFAIRSGDRVEFVDLPTIDWIEAENYYVRLHAAGREHLLRDTLTRLETRLRDHGFLRVHRSALVRISRIRAVRSSSSGALDLELVDGTTVRASRSRRMEVLRELGLAAGDDAPQP